MPPGVASSQRAAAQLVWAHCQLLLLLWVPQAARVLGRQPCLMAWPGQQLKGQGEVHCWRPLLPLDAAELLHGQVA